jgi:hypothetical protein
MTKAYKMDRSLCYRMAEAGRGRCFAIDTYEELPVVMGRLMREVLRSGRYHRAGRILLGGGGIILHGQVPGRGCRPLAHADSARLTL